MIKQFIRKKYHSVKRYFQIYELGKKFENDPTYTLTKNKSKSEMAKRPFRFEIINFLAESIQAEKYLEIGVRNPEDNFNKINIKTKFSVDPGVEFKSNPVDYQMTSDTFFEKLKNNELNIKNDLKFHVIFIDGLHLADQVERDIKNAIQFLSDDGFVVLHDCNPPTEFHARETYNFYNGPAGGAWNGTTWKAFFDARSNYHSCCIDSDWGVGIISKKERNPLNILNKNTNPFFEFQLFDKDRINSLNLMDFDFFRSKFESSQSINH